MGYSCQKCKKKMRGHRIRCRVKMSKRSPKIWKIGLCHWIWLQCLFVQKIFQINSWNAISNTQMPNTVYVNLLIKLIQLLTFLSGNLVIWQSHLHSPNSCKMAGFHAAKTEILEIFKLPKFIFCSFFYNLSRIGRKSCLSKKNLGVTDHLRE